MGLEDVPGGPGVKIPPSNAGDVGSIPGQGMKIPHDSQCAKKKNRINRVGITISRTCCGPDRRPFIQSAWHEAAIELGLNAWGSLLYCMA